MKAPKRVTFERFQTEYGDTFDSFDEALFATAAKSISEIVNDKLKKDFPVVYAKRVLECLPELIRMNDELYAIRVSVGNPKIDIHTDHPIFCYACGSITS